MSTALSKTLLAALADPNDAKASDLSKLRDQGLVRFQATQVVDGKSRGAYIRTEAGDAALAEADTPPPATEPASSSDDDA